MSMDPAPNDDRSLPAVSPASEPDTAPTVPPPEQAMPIVMTKPQPRMFWRKVVASSQSLAAPSSHPWRVVAVSALTVVLVGGLILFAGPPLRARLGTWLDELEGTAPDATASNGTESEVSSAHTAARRPGRRARRTATLPRSPALSDPDRLIVQPGTALPGISDALEKIGNGGVIEVASNAAFTGELKLPALSLTLIANREFQPVLRDTVRISGGGTVRIEGFHFESAEPLEPAIEIGRMPGRLELVGCSFRSIHDGILIWAARVERAGEVNSRLTIERCFAAGNILCAFGDTPIDLHLENNCIVAEQTALDWELTPDSVQPADRWGLVLRNNTVVARTVFGLRLADEGKAIADFPLVSIRLDDNIFVSLPQFPSTFLRWESWQRPEIPLDRFVWSGGSNAVSGLRPFTMAATLALNDRAASLRPYLRTPEEWQSQWAKGITQLHQLPPEFRHTGKAKDLGEILPDDFELAPKSKMLKLGTGGRPLGAEISLLP
jgi:hypothetical protein